MNMAEVSDPFGVAGDAQMPFLKDALDPAEATRQLQSCISESRPVEGVVCAIRVRRYKPGRRCLIEYQLRTKNGGRLAFLGKVRAKEPDRSIFAVVQSIWNAGFSSDAPDGICVPEPIGMVPAFNMWLQTKIESAELATDVLRRPGGRALASRIAEAARKLHLTGIPTPRQHTLTDELRILRDRLSKVQELRPEWEQRLDRLAVACDQLARSLSSPASAGIHRDFYSDHVLVHGSRLWLVDFDLYCHGDPALDMGNFIAHVTEQSLRDYSDPAALHEIEQALENRFVELNGERMRSSVVAYTNLSLARHIYISTLFPERQPFTERLLELCEQRLVLG